MTTATRPPDITDSEWRYLMQERQACIIRLGALEDRMGLERSIVPRRKREPTRHEELRDKFDHVVTARPVVKYGES